MQPQVSLIIIGYNSKKFLKTCFDAIFAQTYGGPLEVMFIDNNSTDDSVEWVKGTYKKYLDDADNTSRKLIVIKNTDNVGYTGAANQGIKMSKGDYVVITNPDIIYTPEYFEKAIARMQQDIKIAALTGKVIKYDFDAPNAGGVAEVGAPTNLIDTVGLAIYRSRRVIDDGQGLVNDERFETEEDKVNGGHQVFGVSGACPLYRRTALDDAKLTLETTKVGADGTNVIETTIEFLDGNFFMYKEDVDLSWRLTLLGWKCWYTPEAIAYHGRGTGVAQRFTTEQMLNERTKLTPFQKGYSYTNQRLMQVKNELWGNFWHDFLWIAARELGSLAYMTIREPYLWKSVVNFFKLLDVTLAKRRQIMARVEERWRERGGLSAAARSMQQWFVSQSRYVD